MTRLDIFYIFSSRVLHALVPSLVPSLVLLLHHNLPLTQVHPQLHANSLSRATLITTPGHSTTRLFITSRSFPSTRDLAAHHSSNLLALQYSTSLRYDSSTCSFVFSITRGASTGRDSSSRQLIVYAPLKA
jgi:hypothetical protein